MPLQELNHSGLILSCSGAEALLCRLKKCGLSTAGHKKDLEARLRQDAASVAGSQQQGDLNLLQEHEADQTRAKSRGASSTGVFKAQKRKNFVRINLKVWPVNCSSANPGQNMQFAITGLM